MCFTGEGSLLLSPNPFLPDPSSPSAASAGSSGTTSALPPQLLETPRGGYVSRSQPVSLHCRADHVLHVYFRCNGRVAPQHREHSLADLVDPQTGVRQLEKQLLVEWQDVEQLEQEVSRSGAGDGVYRCECVAWSSRGENVSRPAEIRLAYLRKQFRSPPFSESVELGHSAELRCVPPEGSPVPTISWLKNGVEVSERVSDNYMVTGEASLLVVAAGLQDMANYSCVAENTANRRVSPPACSPFTLTAAGLIGGHGPLAPPAVARDTAIAAGSVTVLVLSMADWTVLEAPASKDVALLFVNPSMEAGLSSEAGLLVTAVAANSAPAAAPTPSLHTEGRGVRVRIRSRVTAPVRSAQTSKLEWKDAGIKGYSLMWPCTRAWLLPFSW